MGVRLKRLCCVICAAVGGRSGPAGAAAGHSGSPGHRLPFLHRRGPRLSAGRAGRPVSWWRWRVRTAAAVGRPPPSPASSLPSVASSPASGAPASWRPRPGPASPSVDRSGPVSSRPGQVRSTSCRRVRSGQLTVRGGQVSFTICRRVRSGQLHHLCTGQVRSVHGQDRSGPPSAGGSGQVSFTICRRVRSDYGQGGSGQVHHLSLGQESDGNNTVTGHRSGFRGPFGCLV